MGHINRPVNLKVENQRITPTLIFIYKTSKLNIRKTIQILIHKRDLLTLNTYKNSTISAIFVCISIFFLIRTTGDI